ncbi:MAG: hypothetical protein D6681_20205 [Calditrichaeota bacterium]|nr:MAG: hypothetical protein D6681_20205 [Calditrichota bacterium]
MASQGYNNPSSATNANTGQPWTDISLVTAPDGRYATNSFSTSVSSQRIKVSGFGFNLPSDATVTGMELIIRAKEGTGDPVAFSEVQITLRSGVQTSSRHNDYGELATVDTDYVFGGPGDLWGETSVSVTDVNNSTFGARIRMTVNGSVGGNTASVDWIGLRVYYVTPGTTVKHVTGAVKANPGRSRFVRLSEVF